MKNNWLDKISFNEFVKWGGIALIVFVAIWYIVYYVRIVLKEREILKTKNDLDNIEPDFLDRMRGPVLGQDFLDKKIEQKEKPLRKRLERLQMERQFMLDKLSLIGVFKN